MNKWTQHHILKHLYSVPIQWSLISPILPVYKLISNFHTNSIFSNEFHNFLEEGIQLQEDMQD